MHDHPELLVINLHLGEDGFHYGLHGICERVEATFTRSMVGEEVTVVTGIIVVVGEGDLVEKRRDLGAIVMELAPTLVVIVDPGGIRDLVLDDFPCTEVAKPHWP